MAGLARLDSKIAAVAGEKKANRDKSKKSQCCKFFWHGQCNAYREAIECNYGHHLPDDKSRKHVAHPYAVKGLNDGIDLTPAINEHKAKAAAQKPSRKPSKERKNKKNDKEKKGRKASKERKSQKGEKGDKKKKPRRKRTKSSAQ
eukprot:6770975-Karenia_brevis.AAC.1